ncbi:MAG: hypothetical protein LBH56_03685 [Coriobacteriales bacterium]|jgi:hypothetical protein|nr:hypothetical protein [Coriobacteriales bacterium]
MDGILAFRQHALSLTYDAVRSFRPRAAFKPICSPMMPLKADADSIMDSIMDGILASKQHAGLFTKGFGV